MSEQKTVSELVNEAVEAGDTRRLAFLEVVASRGIDYVCEGCSGLGTRTYPSTATWVGDVGGQMICTDVCDRCWGSGDATRPWPNRRDQRAQHIALTTRIAELEGAL